MTNRELLNALGNVDDQFIAEAAPTGKIKKKHSAVGWIAAAACLALVVGVAVRGLWGAETNGRYKNVTVQGAESALVLRWEDMTMDERYASMTFAGREYRTRGLAVGEALLDEKIGSCSVEGHDVYSDKTYRENFDVYEITGIQGEKLVAVAMEGAYYVFLEDGYAPPATLGALMEVYGLAENLPLSRFTDHCGKQEKCYLLENDDAIWQILTECADAAFVDDDNFRINGNYISFTATSEALGIYKRVFYVTEDGYVKTNALDYGYAYFIGEDAAGRILDYALSNATETEPEPYTNFVAGTITEIGDGYILVNDAILCRDERDGVTFKILTHDPKFSRWMKYYNFRVGDVVYIQYRGEAEEGNLISGAYAISEATISGGDILIQE